MHRYRLWKRSCRPELQPFMKVVLTLSMWGCDMAGKRKGQRSAGRKLRDASMGLETSLIRAVKGFLGILAIKMQRPGIEPGPRAWKARMLTTTLSLQVRKIHCLLIPYKYRSSSRVWRSSLAQSLLKPYHPCSHSILPPNPVTDSLPS